jgi:hypothetical protein
VLATLALQLVWTTPAFAWSGCNIFVVESGNSFEVCIDKRDNGYDARVAHYGPTYLIDFNLLLSNGNQVGDAGNFYISNGEVKTYFFATGYYTWAQVLVYWRSGSPYFSPMFSDCWGSSVYNANYVGNC